MRLLSPIFVVLFFFQTAAFANQQTPDFIIPRIGFETELARHNKNGQILYAPNNEERTEKTRQILEFLQRIYGGTFGKYPDTGQLYLDYNPNKTGEFRVDRDWASHLEKADAFEVVTPPLDGPDSDLYVNSYDKLLSEQSLGPGLKTSQQFNVELREIIPGLSLSELPSNKMGVAMKDIENLNIDQVVNLFLFCETNVLYIYAALAPKRLGNLVNYFSVPMIFEHDAFLMELAKMPKSERTYRKVRDVFVRYQSVEEDLGKYAENKDHPRTAWKYRPFNMRKLFMLNPKKPNPTWVFPALEIRPADTATNGEELDRMRQLIYAVFNAGRNAQVNADDIKTLFADYRAFIDKYFEILPFPKAMRLINQDIVSRSLTPEFQNGYKAFLKNLDLSVKKYPPFAGAEPTHNISRSYAVYNQIGENTQYTYAGRTVTIPKVELPWDLTGYTFGAEFEFDETPGILEILKRIPFLEPKVTTEATGNREVITKPTADFLEFRIQVQYMRDVLGDKLKSIHGNTRAPKKVYERIPKLKMNSWLGRMSDLIMTLRANYRNPLYAFGTRTQNRMQIDTPNAWVSEDKMEYRGTIRVMHFDDKVNFEIRGLMNGIFTKNNMSSDMFLVLHLILLMGLNQPEYVEGDYVLRLINEVRNPNVSLREMMTAFALSFDKKLEGLPHTPELLVSALRAPNLMLLPLVGFEQMPYLSAHDSKRLTNATVKWKFTVWSILSNNQLNADQAKAAFLQSLSEWSIESGLEHAMFDSLLTSPAPKTTWSQTHLPFARVRSGFLSKILALQDEDWVKSGFELFLVTWSSKDEKSLVATAKQLDEDSRLKLLFVLQRHKEPARITALAKKLAVKVPNLENISTSEEVLTNLSVLNRNWTPGMTMSTPAIEPVEPAAEVAATEPQVPVAPQAETTATATATTAEQTRPHPDEQFATAIADLQTYNTKLLPIVENVKLWKNRFADGGINTQVYVEELRKSLEKWNVLSSTTPAIEELERMSLQGNVSNLYREYAVLNAQLSGIIENVLVKNGLHSKLTTADKIHFLKIWWHGLQPNQRQAGLRVLEQEFENLFSTTKPWGRGTVKYNAVKNAFSYVSYDRMYKVKPSPDDLVIANEYLSFLEKPLRIATALHKKYHTSQPNLASEASDFLKRHQTLLAKFDGFNLREHKDLLKNALKVMDPKKLAVKSLLPFEDMGSAEFETSGYHDYTIRASLEPIQASLDEFALYLTDIGIRSKPLHDLFMDQARYRVLKVQLGRGRDAAPHIPYLEYLLRLRPGIQMQNLWQEQYKSLERLRYQYSSHAEVKHAPRHHVRYFGSALSLLNSLIASISSSRRFMTDERFHAFSCEEALTGQ